MGRQRQLRKHSATARLTIRNKTVTPPVGGNTWMVPLSVSEWNSRIMTDLVCAVTTIRVCSGDN